RNSAKAIGTCHGTPACRVGGEQPAGGGPPGLHPDWGRQLCLPQRQRGGLPGPGSGHRGGGGPVPRRLRRRSGAAGHHPAGKVPPPRDLPWPGSPGSNHPPPKSLFELPPPRNQFDNALDYEKANQEVNNRLQQAQLPAGVTPQISPASPTGEIYRYTLSNPKDALGRPVYRPSDLKALQEWTLQREFLRVPRIAGVTSSGGAVKRYEVHPDP